MFRIITTVLIIGATGCTHHQLRYNTTHQARTVADVHTQQVLDNLAKFCQDPNAIPHFSYPQGGSTSVTDGANVNGPSFNFTPHSLASWSAGFSGSRSNNEAYTMVPLNDPRKLEMMRCAYQRVVLGQCNCVENGCPDCQLRFNKFYLGSERPGKTGEVTKDGKSIYHYTDASNESFRIVREANEFNQEVYRYEFTNDYVPSDDIAAAKEDNRLKPLYVDNSVAEHTARTGKVTVECLSSCWFQVGSRKDFKKLGTCCPVGSYCGTYVCVPNKHRDQLSKLTMVILDIALNDDAKLPTLTKEVVAYLDPAGQITSKREAAYRVTQQLSAGDSEEKVAPHDKSRVKSLDSEHLQQQKLQLFEQEQLRLENSIRTPIQELTPTPGSNLLLDDLRLRTLTPNN